MYVKRVGIIIFVFALSFFLSTVLQEAIGEEKPAKGEMVTNSLGMKFVLIPAGTFIMGSASDELGKGTDELLHKVTISKFFYLQATEVTQRQWREIMGTNPSHFKDCGDDCPVEKVSWDDTQKFILRLNEREGITKYRLPTEAEWEYACRAGSTTRFCFGNDEAKLGEHAWYCNNSGACIHSVGHKKPNAWGLFDVHGSVWEWCQDRYGDYPLSPVTDPTGPSSGTFRLVRGGAWDGHARLSRSANRYRFNPKCRFHLIGFRVAKDL